jgi:hypothetical protein
MKNKKGRIARLQEMHLKYARQIGLIECEIPILFFDGEEFRKRDNEAEIRLGFAPTRLGGKHTKMWGICSLFHRGIFVRYRQKARLSQLENTLIHELVHYRWIWKSHGKDFDKRIKEIKQGKIFDRKHIIYPQFKSWS